MDWASRPLLPTRFDRMIPRAEQAIAAIPTNHRNRLMTPDIRPSKANSLLSFSGSLLGASCNAIQIPHFLLNTGVRNMSLYQLFTNFLVTVLAAAPSLFFR